MRVAALDYGKVRIGVAVADELGILAHARPAIAANPRRQALDAIATLGREESLDRLLVGLPLRMSGEESIEAERVRNFAVAVAGATGLEVELCDERLTTVEASRRLREAGVSARRGRALIDGAAACVLLQAWLDARRPGS